MKRILHIILSLLVLITSLASIAPAQNDSAQALRDYLGGKKFRVTYRRGGPVYGTYFFLEVDLCRSGNYITYGQSRKQNVVFDRTEQVHSWTDRGRWNTGSYDGQLGIRYVSTSGQVSVYPIRIGPNGEVSTNNGMTVQRLGSAQCE
jgi:hypothetical protein